MERERFIVAMLYLEDYGFIETVLLQFGTMWDYRELLRAQVRRSFVPPCFTYFLNILKIVLYLVQTHKI